MIYIGNDNNNYIDSFINYKNLKRLIYKQKFKIKDLEDELNYIITRAGPKDVQAQSYDMRFNSPKVENVEALYKEIENLAKRIKGLKDELEVLQQQKLKAEWAIENDLTTIEQQVFYLREIEGLTLWEIAIEVNRSYDWVKHINARINKKIKEAIKSKNLSKTTPNNTLL